jgi:ethanolamine permease
VLGYLLTTMSRLLGNEEELSAYPFAILAILLLALLNYRGVLVTLSVNFVVTGFAFLTIIALFLGMQGWNPGAATEFNQLASSMDSGLPYGWIGVIAAFQFGMWFYLGIEGTAQAAEECRSPSRSIPLGSLAGIMTLIIAATITWYVSAALLP